MKKKIIAILSATMLAMVLTPVSALAYTTDASVSAGKYGTLWGHNYGAVITTEIDTNDGTGKLVNGYEVQDNKTGKRYEVRSGLSSAYGATYHATETHAADYPYPCAVFGSHEVRGSITVVARTSTVF